VIFRKRKLLKRIAELERRVALERARNARLRGVR
jgi:hypothetical protein